MVVFMTVFVVYLVLIPLVEMREALLFRGKLTKRHGVLSTIDDDFDSDAEGEDAHV
jgi:hypothetical protein